LAKLPGGWAFSISEAIAAAARERGADIRSNAAVERIVVKNGRAVGLRLGD